MRHGTTSLVAALNVEDGTVISALHRRHRATEFRKFLARIDARIPDHLAVHLICDNYGTHKHPTVTRWLAAHPRFSMHFTPTYSSWINQVERFFAYVTADLLQRSDRRSVQALEADVRAWVSAWNDQAIHVDEDGPTDPRITRTTSSTNYRRRTLVSGAPRSTSLSREARHEL